MLLKILKVCNFRLRRYKDLKIMFLWKLCVSLCFCYSLVTSNRVLSIKETGGVIASFNNQGEGKRGSREGWREKRGLEGEEWVGGRRGGEIWEWVRKLFQLKDLKKSEKQIQKKNIRTILQFLKFLSKVLKKGSFLFLPTLKNQHALRLHCRQVIGIQGTKNRNIINVNTCFILFVVL